MPPPIVLQDEWSRSNAIEGMDQLQLYELENPSEDLLRFDSPIPYWLAKRTVWPQLAQVALDIYSTPAMSDEPERVFSIAGNTLNPRRRCLTGQAMQWLLCLRSWQNSNVIQLDQRLFGQAVITADSLPIDSDDPLPPDSIEDVL